MTPCTCRFLTTAIQGPHWCCRKEGWNAELWHGRHFRSIAHRAVHYFQRIACRKRNDDIHGEEFK